MWSSSRFLAFLYLFLGLSWMSQCLATAILMKNGGKKIGISHGCEKTTRIETKCFTLQEKHRPKHRFKCKHFAWFMVNS